MNVPSELLKNTVSDEAGGYVGAIVGGAIILLIDALYLAFVVGLCGLALKFFGVV